MYAVNFVWQKIIFQFYNQGEMKYKEFIVFIVFNTEKKVWINIHAVLLWG